LGGAPGDLPMCRASNPRKLKSLIQRHTDARLRPRISAMAGGAFPWLESRTARARSWTRASGGCRNSSSSSRRSFAVSLRTTLGFRDIAAPLKGKLFDRESAYSQNIFSKKLHSL
jgi:hypothetical protein